MVRADRLESSALDGEWEVDSATGVYKSPLIEGQDYQRLIFNEPFRNGSISAEITIHGDGKDKDGGEPKVGAVIFRFQDPNNYYYAGLGGYSAKFFIAKRVGNLGQALISDGSSKSMVKKIQRSARRLEFRNFPT